MSEDFATSFLYSIISGKNSEAMEQGASMMTEKMNPNLKHMGFVAEQIKDIQALANKYKVFSRDELNKIYIDKPLERKELDKLFGYLLVINNSIIRTYAAYIKAISNPAKFRDAMLELRHGVNEIDAMMK